MAEMLNDHEQVEALKNWLKNYGKPILAAIIVIVVLLYGWRYWQNKTMTKTNTASAMYQMMLTDDSNKDYTSLAAVANQLIDQYSSTPYASLAQFFLAKQAVLSSHYEQAITHLQWVVHHASSDSHFADVARLRIARVYLELKKPKQALAILAPIPKGFESSYAYYQGQAYAAQKQYSKARTQYQLALKSVKAYSPLGDMIKSHLYSLPKD